MEMCITNHCSYPPPTMALPEIVEEERAKELRLEALEKQQILQYESYSAAASTRVQISEQNSLLLSQLITMGPAGIARRPPQLVLDQIQSLNYTTHKLGHLLCRSRRPDFLLDLIQRQQSSSSQNMPWLAGLVQNSEGSLSQLSVQCLCEFLLSSNVGVADRQSRQQQLLAHLQTLLTDPLHDSQHAYEVLEYFLRRLSSQTTSGRLQALRNACLVENNPSLIQAYISYLAVQTADDELSELTNLVNELSQLIVERNTIVAAILPQPDSDSLQCKQTLYAFLSIFCNYLNKARAPRQDGARVTWSENQDLILVEWSTSEECLMNIPVVNAMIILLTYDQIEDDELFRQLLETCFPTDHNPPTAFLVDTGEEALQIGFNCVLSEATCRD
ncbi:hypothetical protein QAD02_002338 [Eretmocerus hayati]|uniref:Uncharacterized protein n=1 Tax=Eretmocerus hayati TaxID=131215 RepID=A0ACC2NIL1_9HYME|nr:hypothetical protein QAD02_002338 [Eretmocerus hayati]